MGFVLTHGFYHLGIYFLFLFTSTSTQRGFIVEGRALLNSVRPSQGVGEEKVMLASHVGSRPPQCQRRCSSCGHCEAIQVPMNPQVRSGSNNSSTVSTISFARDDYNSNYKPMSWKCKCGNFIFNP